MTWIGLAVAWLLLGAILRILGEYWGWAIYHCHCYQHDYCFGCRRNMDRPCSDMNECYRRAWRFATLVLPLPTMFVAGLLAAEKSAKRARTKKIALTEALAKDMAKAQAEVDALLEGTRA